MEFFTTGKIIGYLLAFIFFLSITLNKVVMSYINKILESIYDKLESHDKRLTKIEEKNDQKK